MALKHTLLCTDRDSSPYLLFIRPELLAWFLCGSRGVEEVGQQRAINPISFIFSLIACCITFVAHLMRSSEKSTGIVVKRVLNLQRFNLLVFSCSLRSSQICRQVSLCSMVTICRLICAQASRTYIHHAPTHVQNF